MPEQQSDSAVFSHGVVNRPMVGESACGDAFFVRWHEGEMTAVVIDGLGHGPQAAKASQAAVECLESRLAGEPRRSISRLLEDCHRALSGTRGAAVAICRVVGTALDFCGVGNVAMNSHPSRRGLGVSLAGVVGYRVRKIRVFHCQLEPGDLVAIYTDGISSRIQLKDFSQLEPQAAAEALEAGHGKDNDDATVLVFRLPRASN